MEEAFILLSVLFLKQLGLSQKEIEDLKNKHPELLKEFDDFYKNLEKANAYQD